MKVKDYRALRWQKEAGLARAWMIVNRPREFQKIRARVHKIYPMKSKTQRATALLRRAGL